MAKLTLVGGTVPQAAITATRPPAKIVQQVNGAIDPADLIEVDGRTQIIWKMAELPGRAMKAMHAAIRRDLGVTLTSTGRGRTLREQWETFFFVQKRYRPCSKAEFDAHRALDDERTKFWPSAERRRVADALGVDIPDSDFWTKVDKGGFFAATAAVPGRSPHGWWCADDLALPDGPDPEDKLDSLSLPVIEWLFAHEREFGFAHGIASEPWHVQWINGDVVPPAVLQFEAGDRARGGRGEIRRVERGSQRRREIGRVPRGGQAKEDDMPKAFRTEDQDAIFLANGIVLAWVNDPDDYDVAVGLGVAPPLDQVVVVERAQLRAFRLVGAVPPGFSPSDFQEVVSGTVSRRAPPTR